MPPRSATMITQVHQPYLNTRQDADFQDEAFYILEGELAVVIDGKWLTGGPGTYVYGPRNLPHGFKVVGNKPACMLLMCAPASFERFVRDLSMPLGAAPAPPDAALMVATAAKYNIDILGPLPAQV